MIRCHLIFFFPLVAHNFSGYIILCQKNIPAFLSLHCFYVMPLQLFTTPLSHFNRKYIILMKQDALMVPMNTDSFIF